MVIHRYPQMININDGESNDDDREQEQVAQQIAWYLIQFIKLRRACLNKWISEMSNFKLNILLNRDHLFVTMVVAHNLDNSN